jgi:enoyl-CoA hydratase
VVARVVPDEMLIDTALEIAAAIVANSPLAMWLTKKVVWSNLDASSFESAIELENRTQVLASMSGDSAEAMRAFVEKRPPVFSQE